MRSDQAARDIRKKKVEHISDQAQRAKIGQIEDASLTAEYHDVLQQEADIYANADDTNRRLCNQALFKAIYVDQDNDVRVSYRTPYDGLSDADVQADALTWAAEAKKEGQVRTSAKGGPLVESSHLTRLG